MKRAAVLVGLVPPGVVIAGDWHPDPEEDEVPPQPTALVAVGRKP